MTHDRRNDPVNHPDAPGDHSHDTRDDTRDDTRVVERQTYVERDRPVESAPVAPAGSVNVNAADRAYVDSSPGPLYYLRRIVSLLFGILAVLIGLRIVLFLLVANQQNAIVDFVFNVTEPFVAPFRGIFAFDQVTPGGGSVFDVAAAVALVGWLLIYILIMAILRLGDRERVSTV